MENEITVKNDLLIPAEKINIAKLFSNKDAVSLLIQEVEKMAKKFEPDLSTDSSRKAIASNAYMVSRTKTFLEKPAKELSAAKKATLKTEIETIDGCRKLWNDSLDALRDEVRKPLTDYEVKEKERIAKEKRIAAFNMDHEDALAENVLFDRQREIERKEAELAQIEAERKAKEEAERLEKERKEREARIAKEAEEKAKRVAEAAAKLERERLKAAEIENLWRSRLAMIPEASWNGQEAFDAITDELIITYEDIISISDDEFNRVVSFRESQLELRKEKEAQLAEQRRIEAEQKAIEEAKEQERKRIEEEQRAKAEREAAAKAVAERKAEHHMHKKRIRKEAFESLAENGIEEGCAQMVVELIDTGNIEHLTINY